MGIMSWFDEEHFKIAEKALVLSVECSVREGGDVLERAHKYYRFLRYAPDYLIKIEEELEKKLWEKIKSERLKNE